MNKIIKEISKLMVKDFSDNEIKQITIDANKILNELKEENINKPKKIKKHLFTNIFPAISLYKAMLNLNIDKNKALNFLDWCWSYRSIPKAKSMQLLCKIPGVYKKMPLIFKKVTLSTFGEDQGFKAKFYDKGKYRCKFDMQKCLFCDTCKKYNCFELTPIFCHTDDVTDGNIHPKLKWNRTKIMGDGSDVCDFDLYVKE